ncbi:MAG: DUF2076 family protein [Burkholderiaceae bacterium]
MNRSERDELLRFLQPLMRTRATDKDFAAETLIVDACARQPDALYLLVQRAMALQSALGAAQARLAELTAAQGAEGEPGSAHDHGADRRHDRADGRGAVVVGASAGASAGAWSRGLRAQVATVAAVGTGVGLGVVAGVTTGVVAGGLLLDAIDESDGLGGGAAAADGLAGGDALGGLLDGLS